MGLEKNDRLGTMHTSDHRRSVWYKNYRLHTFLRGPRSFTQSGRQLHRKCITRVQFYLQRKFACASVRSKVFFAYYIFTQTFLCTRLSWTYVSHAMDKPIIVLTAWEVVGGVPVLERRNSRYKRGTYFTGSLTKAARKLFWQAAMALNVWSQGECL